MKNKLYSEDYKYFDNLIWKVPTWAFAGYTALLVGLGAIFEKYNLETFDLPKNAFIAIVLTSGLFFMFSFSFALFRYRCRQIYTTNPNNFHTKIFGAQFFLQLSVSFQVVSLGLLIFSTYFRINKVLLSIGGLFCFLALTLLYERKIVQYKNNWKIEQNKSSQG
jgi:magnesium-transporting ATPase (P-type)